MTIRLTPITPPVAGVYATTAQLAAYLACEVSALPTGSARMLARASELINYATRDAVDTTNTAHMLAARNAACAQVEYWQSQGEHAAGAVRSKTVGKTSVTYDGAGSRNAWSDLAPRARQFLVRAGLLYSGVGRV